MFLYFFIILCLVYHYSSPLVSVLLQLFWSFSLGYGWMFVLLCMLVRMYTYVCASAYRHKKICTQTGTCTWLPVCSCVRICVFVFLCVFICLCICVFECSRPYMCSRFFLIRFFISSVCMFAFFKELICGNMLVFCAVGYYFTDVVGVLKSVCVFFAP